MDNVGYTFSSEEVDVDANALDAVLFPPTSLSLHCCERGLEKKEKADKICSRI